MFETIRAIRARDPAAPNVAQVLLSYAGFHALLAHRLNHWLWGRLGLRSLPSFLAYLARAVSGIEIHPAAKIGRRVFIDHGMGVVIGETAQVGDDVTLYHGVTLGGRAPKGSQRGAKRHPTLKDGVMVGAGACLLGDITIGEGAVIGANSVVTSDVPNGARVAGNPAYLLKAKKQEKQEKAEGGERQEKAEGGDKRQGATSAGATSRRRKEGEGGSGTGSDSEAGSRGGTGTGLDSTKIGGEAEEEVERMLGWGI